MYIYSIKSLVTVASSVSEIDPKLIGITTKMSLSKTDLVFKGYESYGMKVTKVSIGFGQML